MSEQIRKILSEAMELPPIERAALVEELLSRFDLPNAFIKFIAFQH
jgi:hypothetical protein